MKSIKIEKTSLKENQIKHGGDKDKTIDYKDLMEVVLDIIPQGGFTPKDIRDRNRIQKAIDASEEANIVDTVELEDADYDNFIKILDSSRWVIWDKELLGFLDSFTKK